MFAGACSLFILIVKLLHFVFVEHTALTPLASKTCHRSHQAFRPKTRQAYHSMFRVFVVFCIFSGVVLVHFNVKVILPFLECLVQNKCSSAMVENYVSAIKASFILYESPFVVFNHPKIKYFILIFENQWTFDLKISQSHWPFHSQAYFNSLPGSPTWSGLQSSLPYWLLCLHEILQLVSSFSFYL